MYQVDTHRRKDGRTDVLLLLSGTQGQAKLRLSPDYADDLATRLTNAAREARLADESLDA